MLKTKLTLMLGFSPDEVAFINHLDSSPLVKDLQDLLQPKRQQHYLSGGVYSVTTCVLTIDLMTKVLSGKIVDCIMVNRVHRIETLSGDIGCLVTMVKRQHNHALILGWSDQPERIKDR